MIVQSLHGISLIYFSLCLPYDIVVKCLSVLVSAAHFSEWFRCVDLILNIAVFLNNVIN